LVLGVPAFGLGLAATILAAYLPVLARTLTTSHVVIGAIVGGDGLVALFVPLWVGAASDRVWTRLGRRVPFMIASVPVAASSLLLLPFGRSIVVLAIEVFAFYCGFYAYFAPYNALYSDLVPRGEAGRAQGIQATFRMAGTGAALVGGALLLQLWQPLPYLVGAATFVASTLAVVGLGREASESQPFASPSASVSRQVWALLRDHPKIWRFIVANTLWQITEGGLKTFIVLYLTRGMGRSLAFSSGAMAVFAVTSLVAAPLAGKLADRHGPVPVMRILMAAFGLGLWLPTFSRSTALLLAVLPVVGVGGAMALSLPYAILMQITPERGHGASAGLFNVSSGVGTLLGPLLVGAAVDWLHPLFVSTDGYAAMWPVIGTSSLLSVPLLWSAPDNPARRRGTGLRTS
jgi:MFS family permease